MNLSPTGPHSFPNNAQIGAQSFFDLALTARLTDKYNFRLGANNIFDKSPPIVGADVQRERQYLPADVRLAGSLPLRGRDGRLLKPIAA